MRRKDRFDVLIPSFFSPSPADVMSIANSLNLFRAAMNIREDSRHFPLVQFEATNQAILAAADLQAELVREAYQRREMVRFMASYRYPWSR